MNFILFDGEVRDALLPFTYTRPVADIRIGILTIREKWEKRLGFTTTTLTEEYLEEKFPMVEMEENIMINASFLPTDDLVKIVRDLKENEVILKDGETVAFFVTSSQEVQNFDSYAQIEYKSELLQIKNTWDIFSLNEEAIKQDFKFLTEGRKSAEIPESVHCFNKKDIFIEEDVELTVATLNANEGPIYISKNAVIMEGCSVRGPFSLGENSVLKMGAKIYEGTTIGPYCTIGGEVKNAVVFGYSNKGHEGYLGNSVIGEWCNLGADTNNSNLKNNYSEVKLWSYETERFAKTGLQFCGLMMGDHSKCGINTMFNTGTVVGVSCNIYGSGFQRNFIPSFAWGGTGGFMTYEINKVTETINAVVSRKGLEFDEQEENIMKHLFEITDKYRNFK
ncbi:MAG: GlmU family protein [Flavobacteriaceae bacterium]|nr:GlmU family protein [Flavobacteriaceae bacterium]